MTKVVPSQLGSIVSLYIAHLHTVAPVFLQPAAALRVPGLPVVQHYPWLDSHQSAGLSSGPLTIDLCVDSSFPPTKMQLNFHRVLTSEVIIFKRNKHALLIFLCLAFGLLLVTWA